MNATPETTAPPPLTLTLHAARRLSGLGRTKLYQLMGDGRLESICVGRRRLIRYASLEALLSR